MAPNFSMIAIQWLLTFHSEMAFLLFHLLAQGVLVFFFFLTHAVQEKCIAKLVKSKVNFIRKTDIAFITS